jgi:hypothetical protein
MGARFNRVNRIIGSVYHIGPNARIINELRAISDEECVTTMSEPPFLRIVSKTNAGSSRPDLPGAPVPLSSLDEERREVVASVMSVLSGSLADADEMAACSHLLKHLSETSGLRPA